MEMSTRETTRPAIDPLAKIMGGITCPECGRTFDPFDEDDAAELAYGHDCEAE